MTEIQRLVKIKILKEILKEYELLAKYNNNGTDYDRYCALDMAIKELEQKPRWIPVSERLPEDIKPVIVTWKNTDPEPYYRHIIGKHFIGVAHYMNGKWFWYSSVTEDMLGAYGRYDSEEFDEAIEVVAWMPLPKPYKAESEGKE